MSKAIVMFADGTGNARTARFRTNVWKMYSALDLSPGADQIAYYIDGVGTSAFAPLRLLGGIFGVGVKRNVRELYGFLCRNYTQDDRIYIFGFSRGAFTARVLAGVIARIGIIPIDDDRARAQWVKEALRRYRRQVEYRSRSTVSLVAASIVGRFQDAVAAVKALWTRVRHLPPPWNEADRQPVKVTMVGCWDTVSAYGGPITEMVRGWDQYITPLSLPDYLLHPSIERARHALALDEEREAFLPLLWDECDPGAGDRIKQVWFAGVHSDIGGGYADRGLSTIPLAWMVEEATQAGMKFQQAAVDKIARVADATAPIHDSRGGVGAFYRYQPRRLSVLTGTRPSPLRDPVSGDDPLIRNVVVHPSVLERVSRGCDGYAPIVLPESFDFAGRQWRLNIDGQEEVWRQVAYRRWLQFALLAIVGLALLSPTFPAVPAIDYVDQAWAPAVGGLLGAVPGVPGWAARAHGDSGLWLVLAALFVAAVLKATENRRLAIAAAAKKIWQYNDSPQSTGPSDREERRLTAVGRLRRWWRWTAMPAVFGLFYYGVIAAVVVACACKLAIVAREHDGRLCSPASAAVDVIDTADPCQRLAARSLQQGQRYRVRMIVPKSAPWRDGGVRADPTGFSVIGSVGQALRTDDTWGGRIGTAVHRFVAHGMGMSIRRVLTARWFQPVVALRPETSSGGGTTGTSSLVRNVALPMARTADPRVFYGEFTAPVSGQAYLFVNDATLPLIDGATDLFYRGRGPAGANGGRACIAIQPSMAPFRDEDDAAAARCEDRLRPK